MHGIALMLMSEAGAAARRLQAIGDGDLSLSLSTHAKRLDAIAGRREIIAYVTQFTRC